MNSRLDAIRARFESSEIDGILIGSDENRRYISGFSGTAGNLIITPGAAVLATDFRYIEQAGQQAPDSACCAWPAEARTGSPSC